MGFFDRLTGKKPPRDDAKDAAAPSGVRPSSAGAGESTAAMPTRSPATPAPATSGGTPASAVLAGGVKGALALARERLQAKDLPGAMAAYEELLAVAGDRADVLVAISGDLGSHGHVAEIIELIAPRYDADRHGPATGLNLLQAYLAVRNADAAQHVLDILFALNRPELEERLHGFSNAIAEIIASPHLAPSGPAAGLPSDGPKVGLITVSKPIWFYGLEPLATQILPPKEGRLRRMAFAQLALPGHVEMQAASGGMKPDDELGRLSRGIPLWFAETFYFSPSYAPVTALGLATPAQGESRFVVFGAEWSTENLRQLVDTSEGGLDYIVTGALRAHAGDYELLLRVWEVKSYRERKTFNARWTPLTANEALTTVHAQLRQYMEWSPASAAFAYTLPADARAWIDALDASLGLFLAEKNLLSAAHLPPVEQDLARLAQRTAASEAASLAYVATAARARRLGLSQGSPVTLARSALVQQAQQALA